MISMQALLSASIMLTETTPATMSGTNTGRVPRGQEDTSNKLVLVRVFTARVFFLYFFKYTDIVCVCEKGEGVWR